MCRFSDVSGTDCMFRKTTTNHSYSQENWQLIYIVISLSLLKFSSRFLPRRTNNYEIKPVCLSDLFLVYTRDQRRTITWWWIVKLKQCVRKRSRLNIRYYFGIYLVALGWRCGGRQQKLSVRRTDFEYKFLTRALPNLKHSCWFLCVRNVFYTGGKYALTVFENRTLRRILAP